MKRLPTTVKQFLACFSFHKKEMRLCHLRKRTNPGSAPKCDISSD